MCTARLLALQNALALSGQLHSWEAHAVHPGSTVCFSVTCRPKKREDKVFIDISVREREKTA